MNYGVAFFVCLCYGGVAVDWTVFLECVMADAKLSTGVEVTLVDRLWIRKALELQRAALVRARAKEMSGSEVWHLRGRELEGLNALLSRFA